MRASGLLSLSSPRLLALKTSNRMYHKGGYTSIYLSIQEEIYKSDEMILGLLYKIKFKNGISFDCKSKEIVGFFPDQRNTKKTSENILDNSSKQTTGVQMDIYVK